MEAFRERCTSSLPHRAAVCHTPIWGVPGESCRCDGAHIAAEAEALHVSEPTVHRGVTPVRRGETR